MEHEFFNKSMKCDECLNEIPKESYLTHKALCATKDLESFNSNQKANQAQKNLNSKDDLGLDSVKSLRERLDKRLKAISETMDSISKKDLGRGLSTNRERNRLDFSSVEKKQQEIDYNNYINYNNNYYNNMYNNNYKDYRDNYNFDNNYNNILTGIDNEHSCLPNLNTNETKIFENPKDNLGYENPKGKEDNLNIDVSKNPEDFKPKYNLNMINAVSSDYKENFLIKNKPEEEEDFEARKSRDFINDNTNSRENAKIKNETDYNNFQKEFVAPSKSNIVIKENLNLNALENKNKTRENQEDFNKLDFSVDSYADAAIELNRGNNDDDTIHIRKYEIEENYNPNEINIKNLINNEISKISHDNFNDDEGEPISDNEAENFDIKRKKYNNIAIDEALASEEQTQKIKNYINIYDNEEEAAIKSENSTEAVLHENQKSYLEKFQKENLNEQERSEVENENENTNKIQNSQIKINNNNKNNKDHLPNKAPKNQRAELEKQIRTINNSHEKSEQQQQLLLQNHLQQSSTRLIHDESLLQKIEKTNKQNYLEAQRAKEELERLESNLTMMQRLTHEKWQIRKNAFKQIADLISTIKSNINDNNFKNNNNLNSINFEPAEQELTETMETLFPWFKYLITDANVISLCEGLNSFCFLFDFCSNEQKNKALILFFDELEKLIMHSKNTIIDLSLKIILNALRAKKFANFVISEIIRKLNTNNNKLLVFLSKAIDEMLDFGFSAGAAFSEHYLKLLFEKVVFYFKNLKQQQMNKNLERKKILGKIIAIIFEKIADDLETVKHWVNLATEDSAALDKLLCNVDKGKKEFKEIVKNNNNKKNDDINNDDYYRKRFKHTLFEAIPCKITKQSNFNNNLAAVAANNRENINLKLKTTDANLDYNNYNYPDSSKNKNLNDLNFNSNKNENENSELNVNQNTENIDLFSVLPNEFFNIPYITALKAKKEILENVNKKLLELQSIKDKDYKDFLNIVNYAIDDVNILINLEGIRILKNFCKLNKTSNNQSKLKTLIISCYDKFKDKKTNVKLELFELFDVLITNHIFAFEQFFIFKLQHVLTQKNPIVKINILEYVKETLSKYADKANKSIYKNSKNKSEELKINSRSNRVKSLDLRNKLNEEGTKTEHTDHNPDRYYGSEHYASLDDDSQETLSAIIGKSLKSKTILNFSKLLVDIVKEDSQSQVKDLSIEILLQLKKILETEAEYEALDKYEELISALPNFRVNMIITGKTPKNKNESKQNFEKEYKATLNRIKSSISIGIRRDKSSQKSTGRIAKRKSVSKERSSKNKFRSNADYKLTENNDYNYSDEDYRNGVSQKNDRNNLLYDKNSSLKNKANKSIEKNKLKNYQDEKQKKKNIDSEDDQVFINKYKKLNQKEKEEKATNESKTKKANIKDDSAYLDNSLNYSNSIPNKNKVIHQKQNLQRNIETDISSISEISPITNRTDRTNLEKKMDSAIEYIQNLSEQHIFDYAKSVIRDFLIFIKKATSANNVKEDLDCHFKVILKILNNIYNQMACLAEKLNFTNAKEFINEEIFIQTFKIIVVAPCFLLDIENYLMPFIKKMRKTMQNDKRFMEIYFEILNKFVCFEKKGSSFLQGVDSKNSFVVFYDFFLLDDPPFEDAQMLKKFEPHVLKNVFLTEEQKIKYVKEFRQAVKIIEITQKKIDDKANEDEIHAKENFKREIKDFENLGNEFERSDIYRNNRQDYSEKLKNDKSQNAQNINDKKYKNNEKEEEENQEKEDLQVEENEEDLIIRNYGKIFNNKQNKLSNSNEKSEASASFGKDKNQTLKNINSIQVSPTINFDKNSNNICRTEIIQKIEPTLPIDLDKDILKIKDKIKEKCRKLDMNIKRINSKIEGESNKTLESQSITNTYSNTNIPYNKNHNPNQIQKINISESNNSKDQNILQLSEDTVKNNTNIHNRSKDIYSVYNLQKFNNSQTQNKSNFIMPATDRSTNDFHNEFTSNNPSYDFSSQRNLGNNNNFNIRDHKFNNYNEFNDSYLNNHNQNVNLNKMFVNIDEIKKLILKIPSIILDDCVSEISHYVILENSFMKLNYEFKNEFANFLACSINNSALIKTCSFNCFLQLLEFLLSLLIHELKNSFKSNTDPNLKNIVLKLQELIEKIIKQKSFTEIFKILIFLLRKYLPKDFSEKIDRENLFYLKLISYLFKISLEDKIKQQANVATFDILSEINDLFVGYSPANLNQNIPNLEDLDKIYKMLRLLTDEAINDLKNPSLAKTFLDNAKRSESNKYCQLYMQYLEKTINSILDENH